MGYYTNFNGQIKLKDKKAIQLVRYLLKEGIAPFDEVEQVMIECDGEVDVSGEGKYYDEEIQKICYFIKLIDKNAEGEISCEGEDSFDLWKIILDREGVKILNGEVVYTSRQVNYSNEDIEEQAKNMLNDKNTTKKIILSELKG